MHTNQRWLSDDGSVCAYVVGWRKAKPGLTQCVIIQARGDGGGARRGDGPNTTVPPTAPA